ncbi:hypothetical protein DYB26_011850 [Aphanomyces astaci]|uniref:HECT domain-containing protein n=1 Tax=Aphanomyces astaci TaxID=112090 RepID=A0A3R6Y3X7_APHAT|nr:hypothetical protein DYB26_011850 [Aphanomyces astaci]
MGYWFTFCLSVCVVLCAILAAQDPPSVVRAALHFINDVVVSLSSSSSDNTLCELAAHMLTTKLVPAMLSSLAGLADPMDDDDDAAGTRARFVDVLTAAMTTVSHRALKHVDALCSFVATTLKRPRRRSRRRHVASVGAIDDNPNDLGATEVSLALYVMSIALTHAYDEYHVRFVRDGVYQALEGVAHEPVATANTHAATQLLATYKSNTTTTPALDALAALARDLRGSSNAGVGAVVLRLANVFRSTDGVTSYELTTSAVVPALVEYIQASTDDFREMVATMSDVRWVVALVATVKEAVVSQWNPHDHPTRPWTDGLFPSVVASMTTSGRPVAHVMNLLAQHLNVRLHVNPVMGSSAIADTTTTTTVVLVEPLARVDTMQAFVAAKMFGKDQHHHHEVDDEEDVTATEMQQQEDGEDNTRIRTTLDGHVLPPSMTILEALIRSKTCGWTNDYEGDEDQPWGPVESLWDAPMDLTFHMATTPPNETPPPPPATNCHDDNARGSVVGDCLALLALLYKMSLVPPTAFESPALAMHLQRTCLMQPLVVALQAFPWAVRTIAHSYSFLLPLQAKLHLMYASSFGSARAIQYLSRTLWKLQGGRRPDTTGSRRRDDAALAAAVARVAKMPRLKVRVARSKLLQSAMKLLSTYGGQKSIVEIEYLGEVGTGLGPTTEFYSLVSQAMQAKYLNMWRDEQSSSATDDAESEPPAAAAATPPQEPPPHHAMPVRGFHRVVVIVCNTCAHLSIPTCPTHQCLLTQPIDGSHSSSSTPSGTPEPHCHACSFSWSMHQCRHATTTSPSGSLDTQGGGAAAPHSVSWRWWIVSDSEVAYLSQAYPRGTPSVVHPVLQCSHCDTVTFPGTEAGLVTMVDGGTRMVARTGRRMYERDYRAVTKHASVHCEGTPLTQTNVVLYESDVDTLVALVPQSPEVLDSELDGLGVTSSFQTDLDDAVVAPHGLFPRPIGLRPPSPLSSGSSSSELLARFAFLGKLVAQPYPSIDFLL